jgi:G3E family GTPase
MVNDWLGDLLAQRWQDIYRMKGVLAIQGFDERYVIQGVHALFEGAVDRPWRQGEARGSKLVFIGKDLREEELRDAMRSCLVPLDQAASR